MKAILMSIKPKWCDKIFSGEKTIEVRKVAPKLEPPFKVYVYESIGQGEGAGAVVGEFVCDRVDEYLYGFANGKYIVTASELEQTRLSQEDLFLYGKGYDLVGINITAPKQYDTPKELSEFLTVRCTNKTGECKTCEVKPACVINITRPPQSWMYVEEIEE